MSHFTIMSWKVCTKWYEMKLQGSDQLQTVLALYKQELTRHRVTPSYQRLRTMVKQHIDQTMTTRNFKAQNRIQTRVLVKSHKERTVASREKWETGFSGKHMDNVRKVTPVFLTASPILVKEHNHPLQL